MVIRFKQEFTNPSYPKCTAGDAMQPSTQGSVCAASLSLGHFHHFCIWGTEPPFVAWSTCKY